MHTVCNDRSANSLVFLVANVMVLGMVLGAVGVPE